MLIYKIKNIITDKVYIGFTSKTLKERWNNHIYASKKKNYYFYNSINKYGIENFEIIELEKCSSIEELKEKEKIWIAIYNSANRNYGYNSTLGGEGLIPNEETRRNLSEINKGSKNPMYGKHPTKETIKKMSEANAGSKNHFFGKTHTEESIKKMSDAHKGKKLSEEHRKKIARGNLGKIVSEETRKKMSEKQKNKKSILQYDKENNLIKQWDSFHEITKFTKIHFQNILKVCKNKRKTAGGYIWKYAN